MRQLSLEAVAAGCREEAQRHRKLEAGYCFELFRRALEERDQGAWLALDAQYHYLLLSWVQAMRAEPALVEETAREAFERFWRTLAPRADPLAARFAHVGALLKYLQQCAVTTVLDRRRREQQRTRLEERLRAAPPAPAPSLEDTAVERLARNEQIARVQRWIAAEVREPLELRVLQLSYEHGLSPAEIAARFPAEFADIELVRQLKERVLRRARRAFLDGGKVG